MRRFSTTLIGFVLTSILLLGCDSGPGTGGSEAPPLPPAVAPPAQPIPPAAPVPGQPAPIPGQPAPIPGQPAPIPGQPAAVPVPGQPQPAPTPIQPGVAPQAPAAVPGQPAPAPAPVPGQPAPAPVPGQPALAPVPGQPAPAPVPGQPGATPQAVTPPPPTGDALTDKLNAKKIETAPDFVATSALVKQKLEKNKTQSFQVQLPGPPFCHSYVAVAGDEVKNIDLSVESPAGAKESSDDTTESSAVIAKHCPQAPGSYKLTVAMPKAGGEFAIQVFSK